MPFIRLFRGRAAIAGQALVSWVGRRSIQRRGGATRCVNVADRCKAEAGRRCLGAIREDVGESPALARKPLLIRLLPFAT